MGDAPAMLDGTLAGDVGFDPLGFAKTKTDLTTYREAEIKHGRLAMLAAAGWPVSELMDRKIAALFGLPGVLDESGRVPSVLNGGMDKISIFYWGFCLVLAAGVDVYGLNRASNVKGYTPGDLGFDPLGFYPKDDKGKKWMQTAEIKNGRIAMIAITAFAFQEFASHVAVIDEVPFLFKPFWALGGDATNAGYVAPPDVAAPAAVMEPPPIFEPEYPLGGVAESAAEATSDAASSAASSAVTESPPAIPDAVSSAAADTTTAASVEAAPAIKPEITDLATANKRIAELEAKLSALGVSP